MLSALLFDLDGTLTDTNALHARAVATTFEERGHRVPVERVLREIGMGATMLVQAVLGPSISDDEAEAMASRHSELYLDLLDREGAALLPGALKLIEAAKARGLKVGLATSSKQDALDRTARAAGLDLHLFDALTTASDVEDAKPAPDPVAVASKKLGVHPAETALVGDTPFDGRSAMRAGSVLIGVENGVHTPAELRASGARRVYRHAADVLAHLDDALAAASPGPARLTVGVMEKLMHEALAEAERGQADGGVPIGALVARADGTVLGRGHNTAHRRGSPIHHAEIDAFLATQKLPPGARDLVLVTTLEPCAMCLGAALETRVDAVVWALEAPENGASERVTPPAEGDATFPRLVRGVLRAESRRLLERYASGREDGFVNRLLARTA